jgi:F-type H+-transporting ATPase subunit a
MIFGMLDGVYFHIGPIPVDHLVVTQWGIVAVIGLLAFFCTKNMQVCPRVCRCL